jgi:hypothetical protein
VAGKNVIFGSKKPKSDRLLDSRVRFLRFFATAQNILSDAVFSQARHPPLFPFVLRSKALTSEIQ